MLIQSTVLVPIYTLLIVYVCSYVKIYLVYIIITNNGSWRLSTPSTSTDLENHRGSAADTTKHASMLVVPPLPRRTAQQPHARPRVELRAVR